MRILLLVNNWVGWQIASWLKKMGENIIGLVLHPDEKRNYGDEIIASTNLPEKFIFDGSSLDQLPILLKIKALKADIALSIFFDYIFKDSFIGLFKNGVINLHPSYLPYNRGQYPNVWSIIENTPAGVTLHYVDSGIDTGNVIAQQQIPVSAIDTGETLYRKLEEACLNLFIENWPLIKEGKSPNFPQIEGVGTYHRTRDVDEIDEIDLDQTYIARNLINILRARTFPPHKGAYFKVNEKKIYMQLYLYEELVGE